MRSVVIEWDEDRDDGRMDRLETSHPAAEPKSAAGVSTLGWQQLVQDAVFREVLPQPV